MKKLKFEMHFHTKESSPCGHVLGKEAAELFKKAGYDGVVVTDHFNELLCGSSGEWGDICNKFLEGYQQVKQCEDETFKVLLGMEIKFSDNSNEFLVYGISEKFLKENPWLYMKDLAYLYDLAEKNNLLVVQAHPFRNKCFLAPVEYLHGVEVYNGNPRHESKNELAQQVGDENELIQITASDFHRVEDVSGKYYIVNGWPLDEQDLINKIKEQFTNERNK